MAAALDLEFNEEQAAVAAAVDRFCRQQDVEQVVRRPSQPFPGELWQGLAKLGVFAPAAPGFEEAGGALEACAICETLGRHAFPGPIPATYLAMQVLQAEDAGAVCGGTSLVSLSDAGDTLLPWGYRADIFLEIGPQGMQRCDPPAEVLLEQTLGDETWGRATLSGHSPLAGGQQGVLMANIATAACLGGAAARLLELTSEHAATRRQFGAPIGDFQAVAHPLADAAIALAGTRLLARSAAARFDGGDAQLAGQQAAGAAIAARRAALNTAFACHQVLGGIGVTLAGPAFHYTRRIRQLASLPPAGSGERDRVLAWAGLDP